jgi:phytanoyl-CoA hydroxylase
MFSGQQKQQFAEQGFLVAKGLLDAACLESFKAAYVPYLDALAEIYLGETRPELRDDCRARPFAERFAMLLGASGAGALQHLDPTLSLLMPGYRWRGDLPTAQRPELFRLMREERMLGALEALLGPEITVSPIYHFNLKLTGRQIQLAAKTAEDTGQNAPGGNSLWKFHVGTAAPWHSDAAYGFADAYSSRIINAWIPLTRATKENGCLLVLPGGHRWKPGTNIASRVTPGKVVALPVDAGDVIFLDNNIPHSALDNSAGEEIRWAFNFRYLPTGEPSGRPFLPGFVARSRASPGSELHDAELWGRMWRAALEYLSTKRIPPGFGRTRGQAEGITARWKAATRSHADWLSIGTTMKDELEMARV